MTHPSPSSTLAAPASVRTPEGIRRLVAAALLVVAGLAFAVALAVHDRIPQDQAYFRFADDRTVLGVRNGLNVLSNAAFAIAGLAGLRLLLGGRAAFRDRRERWPWLVFFAGVLLTSAGSAWFHLGPTNGALVWDRLPMTVGFMGLLSALVAERIDVRAGLALLGPAVAAGIASVVWWYATEQAGAGDLRPYFFVQFYPMAAILVVLAVAPRAYTHASAYLLAFGAYAVAKVAEDRDAAVYAPGHAVSGHTLKHLLAACGIGALVWMLARRRQAATPSPP